MFGDSERTSSPKPQAPSTHQVQVISDASDDHPQPARVVVIETGAVLQDPSRGPTWQREPRTQPRVAAQLAATVRQRSRLSAARRPIAVPATQLLAATVFLRVAVVLPGLRIPTLLRQAGVAAPAHLGLLDRTL